MSQPPAFEPLVTYEVWERRPDRSLRRRPHETGLTRPAALMLAAAYNDEEADLQRTEIRRAPGTAYLAVKATTTFESI